MLYYEELFTRSTCSSCQQEIPGLGIECAECNGGNFRICPECFSTLAEIGQHKPEHRYRFFDSGSLVLFPSSATEVSSTKENEGGSQNQRWSAREEIRLLDAIEQYGFGNWCDISKHIETKTSLETKKEFVERFIQGNIGVCTWDDKNNNEDNTSDFRRTSIGLFPKPVDHTLPCDEGPLSPSLTQKLPPLDISSDEMLQLGYMPFRDDYEKEYDNEAEKLVAQLAFSAEDDEVDVGLKLALVDMYASRLRERARRKRIIRDYQLVSKFFKKDRAKVNGGETNGSAGTSNGGANNKDSTKRFQNYERNLQEKLKPFAQFYNSREYDNMIKNLVKEKEVKLRLQELYKYRSNGITRADECIDFERSKFAAGLKGKRPGVPSNLGALDEDDENEDRSHKKALIQKSPAPPILMQQFLPSNVESPSPKMSPLGVGLGSTANASGERSIGSVGQSLTQQPFSRDDFNSRSSMESNGSELALLPQLLLESGGVGGVAVLPTDQVQEHHQEHLSSSLPSERPRAWEGRYTADFIPGSEQLTQAEYNLCLQVNILPAQFLTIKLAHILGKLDASDNRSYNVVNPSTQRIREPPPDVDKKEWKQITDFLITSSSATDTNFNAFCSSSGSEPNASLLSS